MGRIFWWDISVVYLFAHSNKFRIYRRSVPALMVAAEYVLLVLLANTIQQKQKKTQLLVSFLLLNMQGEALTLTYDEGKACAKQLPRQPTPHGASSSVEQRSDLLSQLS